MQHGTPIGVCHGNCWTVNNIQTIMFLIDDVKLYNDDLNATPGHWKVAAMIPIQMASIKQHIVVHFEFIIMTMHAT